MTHLMNCEFVNKNSSPSVSHNLYGKNVRMFIVTIGMVTICKNLMAIQSPNSSDQNQRFSKCSKVIPGKIN